MGKNLFIGAISLLFPLHAMAADVSVFTTQSPAQTGLRDGVNYELGMRFSSSKAGKIKAIRFYKSPNETGTHVGKIYSASGQLLASVTFSGETASGWQLKSLATPLSIAANTEYVVSVNTGNQYYVVTVNGLGSQVISGALKSAVGSNGVYGPVGSKPSNSFQNSNYFRDVVFAEDTATVSPIASKFKLGDRVEAIRSVNVRASGSLSGSLLGTQSTGAKGKLIAGPTSANGYIWWKIDYDSGVDGFSGEDNFKLASTTTEPIPEPTPAPSLGGPPLTFNDSRFANASSSGAVTLANGATLNDKSITVTGGAASILCQGTCNLNRVRVNSREALRIVTGTITVSDSYLEALGQGDDHADVIQAYSPGSRGKLILRNSSIVAHNTAATAGIFIADNWGPDLIDLENVMFKGGPYGLRLHPDGYANAHLRMVNVCFVGPFGYGRMLIDRGFTIDAWQNVNECTIVNGQLIRGAAIPRPY